LTLDPANYSYFGWVLLQDEWRKGMKAMQVDSVDKHKKALPGLQQDV
jgi:hypothetical protein